MVLIGNYLIGSVVGRGKFGWVSRAKHIKLGLKVALKHSPWAIGEQCTGGKNHSDCEHAKQSSCQAALLNEASVLAQISHPAIVELLEVLEGPANTIYICLEDLGNTSLTTLVELDGKPGLPESVVSVILYHVSGGLSHLHEVGILHRDVKPDNIMVIKNEDKVSAKLIDLGLAAMWVPEKLLNTSDVRVGTLSYMAPELMVANTKYGNEVDVFSLGATMYYALFGEPPFEEFTRNGIRSTTAIFGIQNNHEEYFDTLSPDATDLLKSMLNTHPDIRGSLEFVRQHIWLEMNLFLHLPKA